MLSAHAAIAEIFVLNEIAFCVLVLTNGAKVISRLLILVRLELLLAQDIVQPLALHCDKLLRVESEL